MKFLIIALIAVTFLPNVADAKPSKFGFKGNQGSAQSQEVAAATDEIKDLNDIQPAAGGAQEEIESGSTLKRQFKNK